MFTLVFYSGIYDTEFKKRRQNNLDVSYDLNSVMQYDTNTFSKNGKHTMETKSNPNRKLGSTSHFDANDLKKIDKLYCNGGKKCEWNLVMTSVVTTLGSILNFLCRLYLISNTCTTVQFEIC